MIQIQTSGWGIDSQERERIHRQLMVQQRGAWASRGAAQHYSIKSLCSGKLSCKSIVSPGYLYIILFIVNRQSNPTPSVILVPFPRCTILTGWKVPNPISSNVFFFFYDEFKLEATHSLRWLVSLGSICLRLLLYLFPPPSPSVVL